MSTEPALDSVPADQQGSFSSFLKTLASFTGDLSNLTCPSFLLAPISLLEYSAFWVDQPSLFNEITEPESAEERFYAAVRWYISALNGSFASRVPKGEWEKKPFNPVLGEQFFCSWKGDTSIVCEQVSHHPPISGFFCENKKSGVYLNGHDGQKTRFSGTQMLVDQVGHCVIHLKNRNDETYLFTLPSLSVNGIWYAAPYVELYGSSYVQSSTGYFAQIDYSTKGWISGELHHFKATVSHEALKGPTVIEGQWTAKSTITKHKQSAAPFLDLTSLSREAPIVKPVDEQSSFESRKLWSKVSEALLAGDYAAASTEKSLIENQKRAERKDREVSGEEWHPEYFVKVDGDKVYGELNEQLAANSKHKYQEQDGFSWVYKDYVKQ
ncbi:hypothetical protein INT43_008416 [Umbelopsis isabellina]|uniref:Oxysterol-binding protein n=1 Tax=Mortierella isabellina TaxID=91625 RepID=A0A8H7PV16_MORIS|nr:hypothetical protein INT43_008416 [Umbelopsis isabellina]